MFKQGAFVNILTGQSTQWVQQFRAIEKFPSLDHIELWVEHIPRGHELKIIRDVFRGVHLIVHGPFIHTSLVSDLPDVVRITERRFDETIEFASAISAKIVTFHAGSYPLFLSKDEVLETLASRFERFSELQNPVATLENMPIKSDGTVREPIGSLSDCEMIIKLLPKLKLTLDIGHCLQNGDDFVSFIRLHHAKIENIHLHDGLAQGKAHLGLGKGSLDLDSFLKVLMAVSFSKHVGIETIRPEDTRSSWELLCRAEVSRGLRNIGCMPGNVELLPKSSSKGL